MKKKQYIEELSQYDLKKNKYIDCINYIEKCKKEFRRAMEICEKDTKIVNAKEYIQSLLDYKMNTIDDLINDKIDKVNHVYLDKLENLKDEMIKINRLKYKWKVKNEKNRKENS